MRSRATQRAYRRAAFAFALLGPLLSAGCESSQSSSGFGWGRRERKKDIDAAKVETRDDVVQIIQYWPQMPWLQHADRIVGFKVTVYFVSGQTEKGAFVPGNIFVWMYTLEPTADGRRERKLAYVWEFKESESVDYRVTKRAIGGYYYGFPLTWPPELRLEGKQVEIQFGYERMDKTVALSPVRRFRVPIPAGYQPPNEEPGS